MRLPRPVIKNCCVHITHRCQERKYLLRCDIDRKYYQLLLYQASEKFRRVRFLNYVITSNHIHLLLWAPRMENISEMMHWLQGTFALYYNHRKKREGSFWRGRFHPTLIENGDHLSRCMFYIDMNMVRARVTDNPVNWSFGGYQELSGRRQRYKIIDQNRLLNLLGKSDILHFREWYIKTLDHKCSRKLLKEDEKFWSSSFAVGGRKWFEEITLLTERDSDKYLKPADCEDESPSATYILQPPQSVILKIWRRIKSK
jgi:REP-associated tyrosine transposase